MSAADRTRWDARYGAPGYLFGIAPNAFLVSQAHRLRPGMDALCVADGEGRNSVWLAERGLRVAAFDVSPVGVEKARALAAARGVEVLHDVASAREYAWPEAAFDVVAAIFVQFADPPLRAFMFERMARALRPGGWLFLEGYTPLQLALGTGGPPEPDKFYTEELLRGAFPALEIVELRAYEADLAEGERHVGRSALIDLVARRPLPDNR